MSETEDFLAAVMPRQELAETAIHRGDVAPRKVLWSEREPVTVLGAARSARNRAELDDLFDWLASRFSNGEPYRFELVAAGASGDLGYVAGYEHTTASIGDQPPASYDLRVTLVFRRENGEWRAVHRHADPVTTGQRPLSSFARADRAPRAGGRAFGNGHGHETIVTSRPAGGVDPDKAAAGEQRLARTG